MGQIRFLDSRRNGRSNRSSDDIQDIWVQYKATKDAELRRQLIEHYVPLLKVVVGRVYPTFNGSVEYDDLMSYGAFGLMDAIDKYDLNKEFKFETYASIRIRGAIMDWLREIDWVPRSVRSKAKELQNAINEFELVNGREPTTEELAAHMKLSVEAVEQRLMETATFNMESLEEVIAERGDFVHSSELSPEQSYERTEVKEILSAAIDALPERDRQIMMLYYYEELTIKEIAQVFKLTESRVSQIHSRIVLRLKNKLSRVLSVTA